MGRRSGVREHAVFLSYRLQAERRPNQSPTVSFFRVFTGRSQTSAGTRRRASASRLPRLHWRSPLSFSRNGTLMSSRSLGTNKPRLVLRLLSHAPNTNHSGGDPMTNQANKQTKPNKKRRDGGTLSGSTVPKSASYCTVANYSAFAQSFSMSKRNKTLWKFGYYIWVTVTN